MFIIPPFLCFYFYIFSFCNYKALFLKNTWYYYNFNLLIEKNVIEVAPLAYMRGRTLEESFVILDEAQNTTPAQMRMVLTRLGERSRMVVTGDITQVDLPYGQMSGLIEAADLLEKVDGISVCRLTSADVVRHPLVQSVVDAYAELDKKRR